MDAKVFEFDKITSVEVRHLKECDSIKYFPGSPRALFKAAVEEGYYDIWGEKLKQINSQWIKRREQLFIVKDREVYFPADVTITFSSGEKVRKTFENNQKAVQYASQITDHFKKPITFINDEKTSY